MSAAIAGNLVGADRVEPEWQPDVGLGIGEELLTDHADYRLWNFPSLASVEC
jgi:hypothetical protein